MHFRPYGLKCKKARPYGLAVEQKESRPHLLGRKAQEMLVPFGQNKRNNPLLGWISIGKAEGTEGFPTFWRENRDFPLQNYG